MAVERFGGKPDDPNRPSENGPAEDDSRISAADTGPTETEHKPPEEATPSAPAPAAPGTPPAGAPTTPGVATPGAPGFATPTEPIPGMPGIPTAPLPGLPTPVPPPAPRRGSMSRQEAGITQPRPPTVAEARTRDKARKRAEEQERAEAEAAQAKKKKRKKLLIGGIAVVGVAGLVGGGYLAYSALTAPEVTAYCTIIAQKGQVVSLGNGQTITADHDDQEIIVPDDNCQKATASGTSGTYHGGGIYIFNGGQYRYYYGGGSNTVGKAPSGGTTVKPKGASITTKSGTTIQRGGLGSKSSGSGS
ncbi:hypothetical protein [Nocardia yamanashiensis]|uniref:hypothetical protein n=1 Tax=Nocardia yamanashiensis TaxID=209247 RepID=UPI000AE17215|nr:hypothetical protein [Nocardia yamanashiensis]